MVSVVFNVLNQFLIYYLSLLNKEGSLIVFALFLRLILLLPDLIFFPPKLRSAEISVTTAQIVLNGDMVDMEVNVVHKGSKFKMLDS